MTDPATARELQRIAETAACAPADRLRTAFRSRPAVQTKRDFHDPVTEHDRAAEETIRAVLARHAPNSVVVGEEGGEQTGAGAGGHGATGAGVGGQRAGGAGAGGEGAAGAGGGSQRAAGAGAGGQRADDAAAVGQRAGGGSQRAAGAGAGGQRAVGAGSGGQGADGAGAGGEGAGGVVRWYVDPIDGTANFAAGLPFFCTSVAAVVDGEVVAGAVYDPVRDDLFAAGPDGATCNGIPLRSAGAAEDRTGVLVTGFPNARELRRGGEESLRRFGRLVEAFATVRRPGSAALSLAHVAGGWADAAYGVSVNAWDVAAALLLVRRAGGVYVPLGGEPDGPDWAAPGYLACVGGFDLDGSVLTEVAGLAAARSGA
ncbi:inositol monophosphatase family protein [Actinomadura gamaensis]|uniref:inositol-phosphate phosphatase n=1 Tax=Actinomadura gamaensis TaxID=1763541 RepID=A0ABV9TWY9_9ACTN